MDDKILERGALGGFRGSVGHKAGGFIAKKKFHPGSMANQEKLWQAREEKRKQREAQEERERRREEEIAEELRLEEQFNTTGKSDKKRVLEELPVEQKKSLAETVKRLKKLINQSKTDHQPNQQHLHVFGSWFDKSTQTWGYACCKSTNRHCLSCQPSDSS